MALVVVATTTSGAGATLPLRPLATPSPSCAAVVLRTLAKPGN